MANNMIEENIRQHIVRIPEYLLKSYTGKGKYTTKLAELSQAIKIINRDMGIELTNAEFEADFGSIKNLGYIRTQLSKMLKSHHLKLRVVQQDGKILIFANSSNA